MKKKTLMFAAVFAACVGLGALDATLLQSELMLDGATASTRTELALIAPVAYTTNSATTVVKAMTGYYGKGELVIAVSGNSDAAYSNYFAVVSATNATLTGATTTLATFAHVANNTAVKSLEVDFDLITGTHWALVQIGTTDNAASTSFAATLYHDAVPAVVTPLTGDAVDKMPYQGVAAIVIDYGATKKGAAGFSGTVQIQSSATSGGTYSNVTALATTFTNTVGGSVVLPYDTTSGKRYLKAVYTATNDVTDVTVWLNGYK